MRKPYSFTAWLGVNACLKEAASFPCSVVNASSLLNGLVTMYVSVCSPQSMPQNGMERPPVVSNGPSFLRNSAQG